MRFHKIAMLTLVGSFASTGGALAGDLDFPSLAPAPVYESPQFHFGGVYAGVYGGYVFNGTWGQAGVQLGYNMAGTNGFVAGIELQAGAAITGGVGFEGNVNLKLGRTVGWRTLIYAEGGVGLLPASTGVWTAGGGIELGLGGGASLFSEVKALGLLTGGCCSVVVQGGLNWHLGD